MLAIISLIIALVIFLLNGLYVLDDSASVSWLRIGLFFLTLGILLAHQLVPDPWRRNPPG
jgi:uncharacterized protein YneF (UPF0154 family)